MSLLSQRFRLIKTISALALLTCSLQTLAAGASVQKLAHTDKSWNQASLPPVTLEHPEVNVLKITIAPGTQLPIHKHPVSMRGT